MKPFLISLRTLPLCIPILSMTCFIIHPAYAQQILVSPLPEQTAPEAGFSPGMQILRSGPMLSYDQAMKRMKERQTPPITDPSTLQFDGATVEIDRDTLAIGRTVPQSKNVPATQDMVEPPHAVSGADRNETPIESIRKKIEGTKKPTIVDFQVRPESLAAGTGKPVSNKDSLGTDEDSKRRPE